MRKSQEVTSSIHYIVIKREKKKKTYNKVIYKCMENTKRKLII